MMMPKAFKAAIETRLQNFATTSNTIFHSKLLNLSVSYLQISFSSVKMSLALPSAPNAGLFKPGYQSYVSRISKFLDRSGKR